jgi:glucan biosynthesis protein C
MNHRLVFMDNLRYGLVLCVVLQHAGNAYNLLGWWPVSESESSLVADWLTAFLDSFTMPFLFYIAGYFALPTLRRKGSAVFVKGKFKRLGIPWLVCILTVCPALPLVYHYARNGLKLTENYWDLWLKVMKSGLSLDVRIIPSMNELMMQNQFYQRYMWFLSLLILFFLIFWLLYTWKRAWFDRAPKAMELASPSISRTLKTFTAVGLSTTFLSFITVGAMFFLTPGLSNPEPLFTLANVIQFRPSRLFFFIIYFGLGVLTFRNKWIERGLFPGHGPTWGIAFAVFLIFFFYSRSIMLNGPEHLRHVAGGPLYFLFLNFLCVATLGTALSLAKRHWNRPTSFDTALASHSYDIYLSHYPFVIAFQLMLFSFPQIHSAIKFGVVALSSGLCAYLTGRYLTKPFPKTAVILTITFSIMMFTLIRVQGK